jgi:hypothetical protein
LGQACLQRRRPWQPGRRRKWRSQPPGQPVSTTCCTSKSPRRRPGAFQVPGRARSIPGTSPPSTLDR